MITVIRETLSGPNFKALCYPLIRQKSFQRSHVCGAIVLMSSSQCTVRRRKCRKLILHFLQFYASCVFETFQGWFIGFFDAATHNCSKISDIQYFSHVQTIGSNVSDSCLQHSEQLHTV